jgi:hypothetical protein
VRDTKSRGRRGNDLTSASRHAAGQSPKRRESSLAGPNDNAWQGPRERHKPTERAGGWWAVTGEPDGAAVRRGPEETQEHAASDDAQRHAGSVAETSKSKKELYREAKSAGIKGRSGMSKSQLVEALRGHYAASPSDALSGQARTPAPPPHTGREARPGSRKPRVELGPQAGVRRRKARALDRCAIGYRESDGEGEFQVLVTDADGSHRSAARSPAFPASAGEVRRRGAARAAHELLVQRLLVCGWWPSGSGGEWPELEFIRPEPADPAHGRSLVTVVREGGRAHFAAEELDNFGNPTPLDASDAFRAPPLIPVRPSRQAKAALKRLLARMEDDGWKIAGQAGDAWYAIWLSRRRSVHRPVPDEAFK